MKKILLAIFAFVMVANAVSAEPVVFNTKSKKVHVLYCRWVKKCTVNCIEIDRKEAYRRGGVPCKVCGG